MVFLPSLPSSPAPELIHPGFVSWVAVGDLPMLSVAKANLKILALAKHRQKLPSRTTFSSRSFLSE